MYIHIYLPSVFLAPLLALLTFEFLLRWLLARSLSAGCEYGAGGKPRDIRRWAGERAAVKNKGRLLNIVYLFVAYLLPAAKLGTRVGTLY